MLFKITPPQIPDAAWHHPLADPQGCDPHHWQGMPLGGWGAGTVGRSPGGMFNFWSVKPGDRLFAPLPACQFSVFEQVGHHRPQVYAMGPHHPEKTPSRWQCYPPGKGTYSALYPRSWSRYEGVFHSELICEQFSPVWAGSYQESSYPLVVFEWTAHNPTDEAITLSIMFTWQNMMGWQAIAQGTEPPTLSGDSTGNFNQWIQDRYRVGCLFNRVRLKDQIQAQEGQGAIATVTNPSIEVFYHGRWNPQGDGSELWDYFAHNGSLPDYEDETPAAPQEQLAAAIAVRLTLRPGKTKRIPFYLAWDSPIIEFQNHHREFHRYTDFFGRTGNHVWTMIRTAMKHSDMWKEKIEGWQRPILEKPWPQALKMALFNELYLLGSGGTLWTAATEEDPLGKFAILQDRHQPYYESLKARFFSSWALALLWPRLDQTVLENFCRQVPRFTDHKPIGAPPTDLGRPHHAPWEDMDANPTRQLQNHPLLAAMLTLQVYRDFWLGNSESTDFLWDCWPSLHQALTYGQTFDRDGDGIPEVRSDLVQTEPGIEAYGGGVWIAALEAGKKIAQTLLQNPSSYHQDHPSYEPAALEAAIAQYDHWLATARPRYHGQLWRGDHHRLNSGSTSPVLDVHQLWGEFYAQLLALPSVMDPQTLDQNLSTISDRYLSPEAATPSPILQTPEVSFILGALLCHQGRSAIGLDLCIQSIEAIYGQGQQFRTPETLAPDPSAPKSSHSITALAIWLWFPVLNP